VFLQQRGAAAVPILTQPFEDVLARILSYYRTTQPMPHIVIEHPIQNLEPAALAERARQIAAAALALLDGTV
jgi:hypothetical protein